MRAKGRTARFVPYKADPANAMDLAADHPAVVEGRTLFPGTVVGPFESAAFLVSGKNSPKTGGMVEKGPWAGMPIFTLTLEERATCPRSCVMWRGCYGAGMPYARRNDAHDPDFIPALKAELITLVRKTCAPQHNRPKYIPPRGIVVRLHILGDFFSLRYMAMWAKLMKFLPELHVFGYTARGMWPADGDMSIATAIKELNDLYPDRWVIRWSADVPGPMRSIVVMDQTAQPNVIICPAQTSKSESCSTCGLCWLPAAKEKTIAFLRHGASHGGRRGINENFLAEIKLAMVEDADERGLLRHSVLSMADRAGVSQGAAIRGFRMLYEARQLRLLRIGSRHNPSIYQFFAEPQEEWPPEPVLPLPASKPKPVKISRDPPAKKDATPVRERKPDAPLMADRPHAHHKGGWGQPQEGSAGPFDPAAAKARVESTSQEERDRIAAQYLKGKS